MSPGLEEVMLSLLAIAIPTVIRITKDIICSSCKCARQISIEENSLKVAHIKLAIKLYYLELDKLPCQFSMSRCHGICSTILVSKYLQAFPSL